MGIGPSKIDTRAPPGSSFSPLPTTGAVIVAILYGCFLLATNSRVTVFEDEAAIVATSARRLSEIVGLFVVGEGQHQHPPLYDLLLHGWLRLAGGCEALVRVPSIVFYCASITLVAATARMLWNAGLVAALLMAAWPSAFYLAVPAHWLPLCMLGISGSTWSYVWFRRSEDARALGFFVVFGLMLVYTNYLGAAFLGLLGLHFLWSRPSPRALRRAAWCPILIGLGFLPLLPTFLKVFGTTSGGGVDWLRVAASSVYYAYALLASEAVAPWHWPAAVAAVGMLVLVPAAVRARELYWLLGILAAVYLVSMLLDVIDGKRMGLFAPWLLLYLTGLVACSRYRRAVAVALALIFATGWAGILSGRWPATYRYVEPWREVAQEVVDQARPGDLIICNHPSFYFYLRYALGSESLGEPAPKEPVEVAGLVLSGVQSAQPVLEQHDRVIYVRSVVNRDQLGAQEAIDELLDQRYQQVFAERYIPDRHAPLKNRFVGNQPPWRIEHFVYERDAAPGSGSRVSGERARTAPRLATRALPLAGRVAAVLRSGPWRALGAGSRPMIEVPEELRALGWVE